MKVLLDTSVLIAAFVEGHPDHERALPRIPPEGAWQIIRENLLTGFEIITLSTADYRTVIQALAAGHISGGAIYDALIARAAEKARVDHLVTLNPDDFRRVWPPLTERVLTP
jgi:predicted nucleic acid-binding protein